MSTRFTRAWGALASTMLVAAAIGHGAPAGAQTSFTYQGQLKSAGAPYNGTADLRFTLYTAASGGSIVGAPQDVINASIADGIFTAELNFGALAFDGAPRWLQIEVKTPSTGGAGPYTPLTPRQPVNPAPYAMYAMNANTPFGFNGANAVFNGAGNVGVGTSTPAGGKFVVQTATNATGMVHNDGTHSIGTYLNSDGGYIGSFANHSVSLFANGLIGMTCTPTGDIGLSTVTPNGRLHVLGGPGWTTDGWAKAINLGNAHAMELTTGATTKFGIGATNLLQQGAQLYFFHTTSEDTSAPPNYYMVHSGAGNVGIGIGNTPPNGRLQIAGGPGWTSDFWNKAINIGNGHAMEMFTPTTKFGIGATNGFGVPALRFFTTSSEDSSSPPNYYMVHTNDGAVGIGLGPAFPAHRLHVISPTSAAIFGRCTAAATAFGVVGEAVAAESNSIGVVGQCPAPGWAVYGFGKTGASGTKSFRIDHPLDPENKYLQHFCAEGPEPLNVYNGTVIADGAGQAWVQLPDYFDAINREPRYQLTAIGAPAPNLHIAQEIINNTFMIAGAVPGTKVSWEVKAVRNDRWVQRHGAAVEVEKPEHLRGKYQHPELYGLGDEYAEFPRNTSAPIAADSEQSPVATPPGR